LSEPHPESLGAAKREILRITCETAANFKPFLTELCFVGGVVNWLNGQKTFEEIGDIDLLIRGEDMARRFWDFVEKLLEQGMRPLYDVAETPRPIKNWIPCKPDKLHPTILTVDCDNSDKKPFKLDIFIDPSVFSIVPNSSSWIGFDPNSKHAGSPDPIALEEAIPRILEYLQSN
jgi:hypothetical protein